MVVSEYDWSSQAIHCAPCISMGGTCGEADFDDTLTIPEGFRDFKLTLGRLDCHHRQDMGVCACCTEVAE